MNNFLISSLVFVSLTFDGGLKTKGVKICCGGSHANNNMVTLLPVENVLGPALQFRSFLGRTELATDRLPLNKDLIFSWSLFVSQSSESFVISQIIGWQPPCFFGGNYQFIIDGSALYIAVKNIEGVDPAPMLLRNIEMGEWFNIKVAAMFSEASGYFIVTVGNDTVTTTFNVIEKGKRTFIDCPLGPYFKAGIYGEAKGVSVYLNELEIKSRYE